VRLVLAVLLAIGSGPPPKTPPVRLTYEGDGALAGHYRVPGETRPFHLAQTYTFDGGHVYRFDETMWMGDDRSKADTETTWVTGSKVLRQVGDGEAARVEELEGDEAARVRERALAAFPGPTTAADVLPAREQRFAHPRLGDVVDRVAYGAAVDWAGVLAPSSLELVRYDAHLSWTATLKLRGAERGEALAARFLTVPPPGSSPAAAAPAASAERRVEPLAPHVWAIMLESEDSRSLVLEFDGFLVVLETSTASNAGEQLVDILTERFPGKPIRFVLFSHHHPHYTGGLRAFIAEGATVLTTPGNVRLVEEIAARPFTIAPDRLAKRPAVAKIESFKDRRVIEDDTNRLEAIDVGPLTSHTDEYLVFYLPRARLLFQGDLGWSAQADGTLRAGRRAAALVKAIDDQKLDVERVVQGWPVAGQKGVLTLEELRAALPK
jgi:glyoxylase-like metal-dependent hydrolase (beta-lactamase superfamily II)